MAKYIQTYCKKYGVFWWSCDTISLKLHFTEFFLINTNGGHEKCTRPFFTLWQTKGYFGQSLMTSSNGNIFRVIGLLCGEFTGHRWIPQTKANDAELWCFLWFALETTVEKQWKRRWFETPSRSLWRHCNNDDRFLGGTSLHRQFYCMSDFITRTGFAISTTLGSSEVEMKNNSIS